MTVKCEVNGCKNYPAHEFSLVDVSIRVCSDHRRTTRKLQLKYGIKIMEAKSGILEVFLDAVAAIGRE